MVTEGKGLTQTLEAPLEFAAIALGLVCVLPISRVEGTLTWG